MTDKRFWRLLEDLPGQQAPLVVWRNRLRDWPLFDQVQRKYLFVTGQRASSLECPTPCCHACPRRVVEYATGEIESICPEQEAPPIKIYDKDLLFYGLKRSAVTKHFCETIGIEQKSLNPAGCNSSWLLGDLILSHGACAPVYMAMQTCSDGMDEVIKSIFLLHSDPFVLIAPTRSRLSAESERMLDHGNSVFIAIEEELIFSENGSLRTLSPKNLLFRKLLPRELRISNIDPLPQNVFRQHGSSWQMRFQGGEAVFLNRQKGAEYITALLAVPYRSISVLDLYANGTMDEQTRVALKAGGFDVVDYRHVVQFREHLSEIETEIAQAQEYNDYERVEQLREEKELFLKQLKGIIGPCGKVHQMNDPLKKPRDAVSKAIRRTIQGIRKAGMNGFADYLGQHIIPGSTVIGIKLLLKFYNCLFFHVRVPV